MAKGKTLTALIGLLKGIPEEDIAKTIADADALEKASAQTGDGGDIKDQWREGEKHMVPGREDLKTGPGQSSSGSGAERMVRDYSSPAPQKGVTIDAEKLEKVLEDFRGYVKSMHDQVARLAAFIVAKAKDDEDEEEETEEESEVVEINEKSARKLIDKAKKLLKAADAKQDDADVASDFAAEKALKREARLLRKRAAQLLGKARTAACAVASFKKSRDAGKALRGEIRTLAAKADINVVQEEEEDEEEEEEGEGKARSDADAAAKNEGKKDAKGNQAPMQDNDSKNQDDSAKKAADQVAALKGQVEDALKGLTTLQGSVHSVLDAISGKAPLGGAKPDAAALAKAGETTDLDALSLEIETAYDNGRIDAGGAMRARDILQKVDAFAKGAIAKSIVDQAIAVAPSAVKSIFEGFLKKAA